MEFSRQLTWQRFARFFFLVSDFDCRKFLVCGRIRRTAIKVDRRLKITHRVPFITARRGVVINVSVNLTRCQWTHLMASGLPVPAHLWVSSMGRQVHAARWPTDLRTAISATVMLLNWSPKLCALSEFVSSCYDRECVTWRLLFAAIRRHLVSVTSSPPESCGARMHATELTSEVGVSILRLEVKHPKGISTIIFIPWRVATAQCVEALFTHTVDQSVG